MKKIILGLLLTTSFSAFADRTITGTANIEKALRLVGGTGRTCESVLISSVAFQRKISLGKLLTGLRFVLRENGNYDIISLHGTNAEEAISVECSLSYVQIEALGL